MYEGKSARGTSSTGRGKRRGSGSRRDGSTGGSPKSIICQETYHVTDKLNSLVIDIIVGRLTSFSSISTINSLTLSIEEKAVKNWTDKSNHESAGVIVAFSYPFFE